MSSGMKRTAAPQAPPGPGVGAMEPPKKAAAGSSISSPNGSGLSPLTYSSAEPADDVNMNEVEDKVTLEVVVPSGQASSVTVDSNIPMLDLLVHLAAKCKVTPSGHVLQVMDEETGKAVDFKANQTIGSLGATTVYIVPKNKKPDWSKALKASKASKAFEVKVLVNDGEGAFVAIAGSSVKITNRFTINLPGGQKAVMRISPQLTLEQVFARVCQDKSLDSRRYTLQHPGNPLAPLDLKATIADSRLSEINLIHAGASSSVGEASRSMPDLHRGAAASTASQDPSSWYMPGAGEIKKKKGFLSFLSKKEKKFKPHDANYALDAGSPASRQTNQQPSAAQPRRANTPPLERRAPNSDANPSVRPKTMMMPPSSEEVSRGQGGIPAVRGKQGVEEEARGASHPPPPPSTAKGPGKKRPAPPPPQKLAAAPAPPVSSDAHAMAPPLQASDTSRSRKVPEEAASSASVSVKAGPEVATSGSSGLSRLHSRNSSDSSGYHELTLSGAESPEAAHVPSTFKTSIDTTSIESADNPNGDSGIQELSAGPEGSKVEIYSERHPAGVSVDARAGSTQGEVPYTTQSTDRPNKPKPMPSTKKRKAPPPPPKAKATPVSAPPAKRDIASSQQTSLHDEADTALPATSATPVLEQQDTQQQQQLGLEQPSSYTGANVEVVAKSVTERRPSTSQAEDDVSDADSGEAFNLNDILDAVKFEEEPLRSNSPNKKANTPATENLEEPGSPQKLAMVERASVVSEDIGTVEDVSRFRGPCEFIPPPPPEEPPPPEDEDADDIEEESRAALYVDKGTVVGEDNASLAPASLKGSPVAIRGHSRSESRTSLASLGSLDTVEGLSLAFEQTIAAGQEALDSELWLEEQGYSNEMARFVAQMSQLTTDAPAEDGEASSIDTASLSLPETDSVSDTGSVIRHGASFHTRGDSKDSQSSLNSSGRFKEPASLDMESVHEGVAASSFAMTEIHVPVDTVPPPVEFQNNDREEEEEEGEEDEEETTTVTEEYIVPMVPGGLDYSAAAQVPSSSRDEEEEDVNNKQGRKDSYSGVFRAEPVSISQAEPGPVEEQQEEEKTANKEEFVLTLEDLSSVSLVPAKPKGAIPPKPAPKPKPPTPEPTSSMESQSNKSTVHQTYVQERGYGLVRPVSSKTSTDFTVPPQRTEAHQESEVLSSKPLSVFQMPSMRYSRGVEPMTFSDDDRSSESSSDHQNRLPSKTPTGNRQKDEESDTSSEKPGDPDSRRMSNASTASQSLASQDGPDVEAAREELQQQYSSLQDQFVVWQQQLQQNQALLAANSGGTADGNDDMLKALQAQMQMQQQMMTQLQNSMEALTQQQQQQSSNPPPVPSSEPSPLEPPPPPPPSQPPPPPVAPSPAPTAAVALKAGKVGTAKTKTRADDPRFGPKLDPREELMISIRSFGGRGALNAVPQKSTKWIYSSK